MEVDIGKSEIQATRNSTLPPSRSLQDIHHRALILGVIYQHQSSNQG
jgi:hypothetical protein